MARPTGKRQAKKFLSKPEEHPDHKFWELEKLAKKMKDQGYSAQEIQDFLIKYISNEKEKCAKDPIYFATTYGFIIGRGSIGVTPFSVHDYQKTLLSTIRNNKFTVNVKSRQLGCSTVVMFYALWFSIFSTGKRTLVVSNKKESAKEFISKLKTAYEYLPEWLKPAAVNYSMDTVEFDTKSRVKAITSNPHAARSFSATLFILDEAAFIEDANKVVEGIMPTLSGADGKLVAISSPNGDSPNNWFYTTFTYAKAGTNGWSCLEFPWSICPDFTKDPNFESETVKSLNGDKDKFLREYCCSFNVRLGSLFSKEALSSFKPSGEIINKCYGGITYDDTFWMWKQADPGKQYVIGVDCSANKPTSRDFSAFTVLDKDTQEQMAEYMGKLPTDTMADILIKTARHYNNALLVIEENNYSEMLFYLLENKGYTNFWYQDGKTKPGFNTNRHSRILLIEKLLLFFNRPLGMSLLRSPRLKLQFENFIAGKEYANGSSKYEAGNGENDDLCFPAGTLITTKNGVVPIQDIKAGDFVLTHTGKYRKVIKVGSRFTNKLLKIKAVGKPSVITTENHPFYAYYRGNTGYSNEVMHKNCLMWETPEWLTANDLEISEHGLCSTYNTIIKKIDSIDLLPFAVESVKDNNGILEQWMNRGKSRGCAKNPKGSEILRYLEIDYLTCFILGYFLAEGSCGSHSISFASHSREVLFRDLVETWATRQGIKTVYSRQTEDNGYTCSFNNKTLRNFFRQFEASDMKHMPYWVMNLSVDLQKYILFGYLAGDGSFANGLVSCASISPKAIYQIYELCLRCGYIVSMESPRLHNKGENIFPHKNISKTKPVYSIRCGAVTANRIKTDINNSLLSNILKYKITRDKLIKLDQTNIRKVDNYYIGAIKSIETINEDTIVYNLSVDRDESYIANTYVVHNCMASALSLLPLTPREVEVFNQSRIGIAIDAKNISSGSDYSDEYIEYHASRMGISPSSLRSRLNLYHDIKTGRYDGTGMEQMNLQHPVEEFDKLNSACEFLGNEARAIASIEPGQILSSNSVMPVGKDRYVIDDIFSESFQNMMRAHNSFFGNIDVRRRGY